MRPPKFPPPGAKLRHPALVNRARPWQGGSRMRLAIRGTRATVACAFMGALALTGAAWAADNGYSPGASDGMDRDFSGSPPAFRLPAPGVQGAPGGVEAPAAPGGADRDFGGSPPAYQAPQGHGEPGGPEPPATAEGPPAEAGPPMAASPTYGPAPFGPGFAVMIPGPPAYGYPRPMVLRRPVAFVHRPFVYPPPMYRPFPPPMIIAPWPPAFRYGPSPWRALVPGP
jgi:hypothetical protein